MKKLITCAILAIASIVTAGTLTLNDPAFLARSSGGSGVVAQLTLTSGMLTGTLGTFNAAQCVDGNISTAGFDPEVTGEYCLIDYGSAVTVTKARLYVIESTNAGSWSIDYSDNGSSWTSGDTWTTGGGPAWYEHTWAAAGAHRYWRFYLALKVQSPYCGEIELWGY
jgi:hypothetical protein